MAEKSNNAVFTAERQRRSNDSGAALDASEITNAELMHAIDALVSQMGVDGADSKHQPADIAGEIDSSQASIDARLAVAEMVRSIVVTKSEIAAITHPKGEDDQIKAASNELDAIVVATETATESILQAAETIGQSVASIATVCSDNKDVAALVDQVAQQILVIFEACGFQDITGQRIQKIVKNIQFIKERIHSMVEIWGPEAFADLPVPVEPAAAGNEGEILSGPQLGNQGISQEEIDALLAKGPGAFIDGPPPTFRNGPARKSNCGPINRAPKIRHNSIVLYS